MRRKVCHSAQLMLPSFYNSALYTALPPPPVSSIAFSALIFILEKSEGEIIPPSPPGGSGPVVGT